MAGDRDSILLPAEGVAVRAGDFVLIDERRGLRGRDVTGWRQGAPAKIEHAGEIRIIIGSSKVDQYNRGELRNHYAIEDDLCVIEAYRAYASHVPQRIAGGDLEHEQLLVWSNNRLVQRVEVQAALEQAAVACGVPPELIGSHSLRFGDASALWAAYRDTSLVRRRGRWQSDVYHS